jgi:hypothetical protein
LSKLHKKPIKKRERQREEQTKSHRAKIERGERPTVAVVEQHITLQKEQFFISQLSRILCF